MKEARIILPERDKRGEVLGRVHEAVRRSLLEICGGYTETRGMGGWNGPAGIAVTEPILIFDVAVEAGLDGSAPTAVHAIAEYIRIAAGQDAVYFRHPDGTVEFI